MSTGETEVLEYFERLSNWGRWGKKDVRGTLNFITEEKSKQAAQLVKFGTSVGCARSITPRGPQDPVGPVLHHMINSGEAVPSIGASAAADWLGIPLHGTELTHIDAPSHVFWNGRMYNDQPASLVSASAGARSGNLEPLLDGVVTRGLLFDIPLLRRVDHVGAKSYVSVAELEKCEADFNIEVQSGDAVLIRLGAPAYRRAEPDAEPRLLSPGLHPDVLPWLHEREVSVLTSDAMNDPNPSVLETVPSPVHYVGIVAMGLWLIDNAELDRLANEASRRTTYEFLFTVAALPIKNATGSPVNPIATL